MPGGVSLSSSGTAYVERALRPLDSLRGALLRAIVATPVLGPVVAHRGQRIILRASLGLVVGLLLAIAFPAYVFALGPIVFGVAHVASDVRYLIVRARLTRAAEIAMAGGIAAVFGLRLAELSLPGMLHYSRVEFIVAFVWIALLAALAGIAHGRGLRAAFVLAGSALLLRAALLSPQLARVVFAHLHNLVAVVLWCALFRGRGRLPLLPLLILVGASAVLLFGAPFAIAERTGGMSAFGLDLRSVESWLAPGVAPRLAGGVILTYTFLQATHYAVWIQWVPEETTRVHGTPTFAMTFRGLVRDFTKPGLFALVAVALVVATASLFDVHGTRNAYLSLANFHGYLELAAFALFFVRGAGPSEALA